MGGVIELNDLAQQKLPDLQSRKWSLADLTEHVLRKRLEKDSSVRLCNWAHHTLSQQQIIYAATDAWIGTVLYYILIAKPNNRYFERMAASAKLAAEMRSAAVRALIPPDTHRPSAPAARALPPPPTPPPAVAASGGGGIPAPAEERGYLDPSDADEMKRVTPFSMPASLHLMTAGQSEYESDTKRESWRLWNEMKYTIQQIATQ